MKLRKGLVTIRAYGKTTKVPFAYFAGDTKEEGDDVDVDVAIFSGKTRQLRRGINIRLGEDLELGHVPEVIEFDGEK